MNPSPHSYGFTKHDKCMKSIIITMTLFTFLLFSCTKERDLALYYSDQNSIDLNEVAMLKVTAEITGTLINDHELVNEVYQAVKELVYDEESVLFADLLDTSKTLLKSAPLKHFRNKFLDALKHSDLKSNEVHDSVNIVSLLANGKIQLYWPYHENWDGKTEPTITFNDGVHKEENIGYKSDGSQVLVNEAYAMIQPVWIISTYEYDGDLDQLRECFLEINQKSVSVEKQQVASSSTDKYLAVKMHQIQLVKQCDPFFDGGSELRIVRAGLIDEYHADVSDWVMGKFFRRPEINNKEWLDFNNTWDTGWERNLDDQVMGCWEYDGQNQWKSQISGTVRGHYDYIEGNDTILVAVNFSFSKKYDGDETALYKNSWNRGWAVYALSGDNIESLGDANIKWTNFTFN